VLAASIRERDKHTCRRCGVKWEAGRRFPVDHIIPWRAFTNKADANDPANLATLCFSCHAKKTHIFETRWLKGDVLDMEQYRRAIDLSGGGRL
jgi:5-methylcytosine-specific restriction endonuclease McrA